MYPTINCDFTYHNILHIVHLFLGHNEYPCVPSGPLIGLIRLRVITIAIGIATNRVGTALTVPILLLLLSLAGVRFPT